MQLALLSAVTYWIANRVASRLQALMGKVCCYVSAWRCGHLRAACNGLRMWCFRLCCRLCFATPSRHAHLATSRHLPPPNYYQRRRRARTAPQASPARTPAIARAKILKSSPLLGSFLGRIFTSWRPGFSHFHKAHFSRLLGLCPCPAFPRPSSAAVDDASSRPRWQTPLPARAGRAGGGRNGEMALLGDASHLLYPRPSPYGEGRG